ncbi:MAG: tetratricopeptide repeat protein [Myxococcota bacterium]
MRRLPVLLVLALLRRVAVLSLLLVPLGCATTPLARRQWLAVETPHFEIRSALSPARTRELAVDLERFRSTVAWAQGGALAPAAARIEVHAFDGRTLIRPFDLRGLPSYFLPEGDGGIVVLRTGGGFRGDATLELRHELAHWVLRGAGGPSPPLWIDEGFAQLLSTIEVDDRGVEIGVLREDHVRLIRGETWLPVERLLEANPGDDWSDRRRFDAETWLLAHYLLLGQPSRTAVNQQLNRYLVLIGRGVAAGEAAATAFGGKLDRPLLRYARRQRFDSLDVAIPAVESPEPRPVPPGEALLGLGRLSLAIDRNEQAADYLEQALVVQPGEARAHAALGEAYTRLGRADAAREQLKLALGTGSGDPLVQRQAGAYYLGRAARTKESEKREELLRLARWHFEQSLALAPSASVQASLASTSLLDGKEGQRALEAARTARELQPASLELRLLQGQIELAAGNRGRARVLAREVWARAHGEAEREKAQALLARSSSFPSRSQWLEGDPLDARRRAEGAPARRRIEDEDGVAVGARHLVAGLDLEAKLEGSRPIDSESLRIASDPLDLEDRRKRGLLGQDSL